MSKSCKFFKPWAMSRIWNDQIRGTMNVVKSKGILTNVTIWSLLLKLSRDILVRSPSASGETSKRRMSSKSTSIEIENPWRGHNLGCPETVFQARNSRVNVWVKIEGSSSMILASNAQKNSPYLDRIFNNNININIVITRLIRVSQSQLRLSLQKY